MIPADFVIGLASGLAVAAVLYATLWWWARRTARAVDPPPGAMGSAAPDSAGAADGGPGSWTGPEPIAPATTVDRGLAVEQVASPPIPPAETRGPTPAPAAVPVPAERRGPAPSEAIRLSQRVILHVYAQGNLPPGAVAPPGLCQAGIGEALGISQGGLAAVLRRLEAAGVLTAERAHVQGHDRRLKVYRLSGRGLEVARELRARVARPARSSAPMSPRRG